MNIVKPGIAIVSTADVAGHRLERDTLERIGGYGWPVRVFETRVDGDIILRTDGILQDKGLLYQVQFESPGSFATDLDAADA